MALRFLILFLGILLASSSAFSGSTAPQELVLDIQDHITAGDFDTAENEVLAAIQKYPVDGGLFNLRGIILAKRNHFEAAEADFTQAIRFSPALASAYLNLGRIYEMQGERQPSKIDSAIDLYRGLLVRDAAAGNVRLQLAKLLAIRGFYARSLSQLSRLPSGERALALALSLEYADLSAVGGHEGARKVLSDLMHTPDLSAEDIDLVLPMLANSHSDPMAVELLENFHKDHDLSPEEAEKLALAYSRLGRLDDSRRLYESLASQGPNQERALVALAEIAYRQHRLEEALGYLAHARDVDPGNAGVHFFFGVVCIELNLPVEAKKSLRKALEIEPANPDYNYARGSVELQGKAAWDAIPYFKKYLAARPTDPRGRFALGVAEFGSQNYRLAAAEMMRVAHNKQTMAGAEYFLGRISKVDSDWPRAVEHLERSIKSDPNYAESHAELALADLHVHELDAAQREIALAVKLNPDSYLVNANLLIVYQWVKDPRVGAQREKLDRLDAERSQRQELMLRTIQVRR